MQKAQKEQMSISLDVIFNFVSSATSLSFINRKPITDFYSFLFWIL